MRRATLMLLLLTACAKKEAAPKPPEFPGNASRGKELIAQYACNTCHVIPGIAGMQGMLGPDLTNVTRRPTLSTAAVPNSPPTLVQFIQNPASVNPNSSMPAVGVKPDEAQDIAAYLHTLQ